MDMVRVGIRCCVKQMLDGGYFHADPHRGNLLMTEGKELAFVDFGMMARVSAEDR
jgi:predicted unusual protein kinase regulating ubiquinone biosynthesis (AarF/ABC1/UbiB family)